MYIFVDFMDGFYVIGLFYDENVNQDFDMQGQFLMEGYGILGVSNVYDEFSFWKVFVEVGLVLIQVYYL